MSIVINVLSGLGLILTSTYLGFKTYKKIDDYRCKCFDNNNNLKAFTIATSVTSVLGITYITYPYSLVYPFVWDFIELCNKKPPPKEDYPDEEEEFEPVIIKIDNIQTPPSPELRLSPVRVEQTTPSIESSEDYVSSDDDYVKLDKLI